MTTEQAQSILADRRAKAEAWTDHWRRDGRFSHGSRMPRDREEIEARVVLGFDPPETLTEYDAFIAGD